MHGLAVAKGVAGRQVGVVLYKTWCAGHARKELQQQQRLRSQAVFISKNCMSKKYRVK